MEVIDLFVMTRNPYFFGVDKDGKQLPYIDTINHRLFEDVNVFNLWITNGEIDFQYRHTDVGQYTLYKESEKKGDYKVVVGMSAGHVAFQPNHAAKDKKMREFMGDVKVRQALSLAIDRNRINELSYNGLCKPRQYSPLSVSPQYYEKASTAFVKFDKDAANKLLDEAGYKDKDASGMRKWKDGSGVLSFTIEGTDTAGSAGEDVAQQVVKMWGAVGIKCAYKGLERSLYEEHYKSNQCEMAYWGGDRTVLPLAPEAPIFRGTMVDRPWAGAFGLWKNDAKDSSGEEPPKDRLFMPPAWAARKVRSPSRRLGHNPACLPAR